MAELATAWISLTVSADDMQRRIRKALNDVDPEGAGRRAGQRFSSSAASATNLSGLERKLVDAGQRGAAAMGKAIKGATVAAAGGIAAAIGTSLKLGFDRLAAIDEAKSKLNALGNDAQTTAQIMDSALASVKGTAFGLGDAATIAASAVAAGVKPGQELTAYLKMTADASAVAGTSLSDMGRIVNQVRTGTKAYTDDLNQLADRGIPIYQWIAQEAGVAAGDVKKMASQGQISSEVFERAITKNIGGAALKMGSSFKGSVDNLKAAMGRAGAAVLEGGFSRLPAVFGDLTRRLDDANPRLVELSKRFESNVFDRWIPKAKQAWKALETNPAVQANMREVSSIIKELATTGVQAWPALVQIGKSLGQASAALGVSSWQVFLTTLKAASGVLQALTPPLQLLADLMSAHPALVTTAAAAWLGFRTVPNILGQMRSGMDKTTTSAGGFFGTLGRGLKSVNDFGVGVSQRIGSLGQFRKEVSTAVSEIQKMEPALSRSQARLVLFAGGAVQAAGEGFKKAGGLVKNAAAGIVGAFGGPWGLALTAGTVALGAVAASSAEAAAATERLNQAINNTKQSQLALNDALMASSGQVTAEVTAGVEQRLKSQMEQLDAKSNDRGSFLDKLKGEGGGFFDNNGKSRAEVLGEEADRAQGAKNAIDNLKLSHQDLVNVIQGGRPQFEALVQNLRKQGKDGDEAAQVLLVQRGEFEKAAQAGREVGQALRDAGITAGQVKNAFDAIPKDMQIKTSAPGGDAVFELLTKLGAQVTTDNDKNIVVTAPLAPEVLQTLKTLGYEVKQNNDKTITVRQVGAEQTKAQLDELVKDRTVKITTQFQQNAASPQAITPTAPAPPKGPLDALLPRMFGAIAMADGGLRQIVKPSSAGLYAGRGAGTIFAEKETGGEAYIPLAPSKRPRSLAILTEVARLFGINSFAEGGLSAGASYIRGLIQQQWPQITNIGGYRPPDGYNEHSSGNALDIMIPGWNTPEGAALGNQVGGWIAANAQSLGLTHFIWRQRIYKAGDTTGTAMEDRGTPTKNHMDHVHAWFQKSGGALPSGPIVGAPGYASSGDGGGASTSQVMSAQASVRSTKAATAAAQRDLDEANAELNSAPDDKKRAAAEKKRDNAQRRLDAAKDRQAVSEQRLSEVLDKKVKGTDEEAKTSSPDGQQIGQGIVSGVLQSIGLDGSVFSNPFEWPNVKSLFAGLNFGGNLLRNVIGSQGGDSSGIPDLGGGPGGALPSIGLPNVTDFIKPLGPEAMTPNQPAAPEGASAPAPSGGPMVAYNGPVNMGVDPRAMTQRQSADMNQALRRSGINAVRPS
ncbi:tape measure protein [Mycobacteroides chelonae]|nr:tape measure protein [Mycobacteroides chelonae]